MGCNQPGMRALALSLCLFVPAAANLVDIIVPATATDTLQTTKARSGSWLLSANTDTSFTLYSNSSIAAFQNVSFTESTSACDNTRVSYARITAAADGLSATFMTSFSYENSNPMYLCLDSTHAGTSSFSSVEVLPPNEDSPGDIPDWVSPALVPVLLILSGIFSGLNLGLMALDVNELQIVIKSGTPEEQEYAKQILPFREKGNLLLCTLLLGNVLVNAVLTILLDQLAGGVTAIVGATAGIVIFGEIVPQSICSRHGLLVGSKTLPITMFFMIVTYPIAKPISMVLDYILGREIGVVFQKKQIVHMLRVTDEWNDLDNDEVAIVTGALTFSDKTVEKIMTPIEDVFALDWNSVLDFKTMSKIIDSGHSRIPVYRDEKNNIEGVLYVKELMFVDPDDNLPLETIVNFYKHEIVPVFSDCKLDDLLSEFKCGRTHMVLVEKVIESSEGLDNTTEVVGVATLEDVIEEIIGDEIIDEHDRISDNANKTSIKPRHWQRKTIELPTSMHGNHEMKLTEQMQLAALTFLTTNIDQFKDESQFSRPVLQRLLARSDCIVNFDENTDENGRILYKRGQPLDKFTLVLEGELRVNVGAENFRFTAGPFTTLGVGALSRGDPGICDFTASSDAIETGKRVQLIVISQNVYLEALAHSAVRSAANARTPVSPVVSSTADATSVPVAGSAADVHVAIEDLDETSSTLILDSNDDDGNADAVSKPRVSEESV